MARGTAGRPRQGRAEPGDTTRHHNAQKTELRQVYYRWHPLFGQVLCVTVEMHTRIGGVAHCQLPGADGRRGFQLPRWMLDAARCAGMRQEDQPRVSWQALLELLRARRRGGG